MKKFDIPSSIDVTIYVTVQTNPEHYNFGEIKAQSYDPTILNNEIIINEANIKIEIPPVEFDITKEAIKILKENRQKELAEHHMRLKNIDDQIMELMTLEYKPVATDCDAPF